MIIRKEVASNGTSGKLVLPEDLIGKFVYVITDDELDKTYNLLDEAMIKLKIYNQKIQDFEKELDLHKSIMNTRMTYIEKIIQTTIAPKEITSKTEIITEPKQ